ncbi:MAG: hypothetical protein MI861_19340 [Pirellulales bacterium]|nr:hypothetical protein [Pirellulales bacterium]
MGRPARSEQFAVDEISIVHTIQRCVRRAFLAGVDPVSGKDYGFRREWIRRRMEALASVFAIDVLSYAVLSNHLHLILRNRPDVVGQWSDEEVALRWLKVFPGRRLEEHLAEPTASDVQRLVRDTKKLAVVRRRLADISWFMRALSEPIARMANHQDECTGRFWEGRFKAQRITDEAGLLACAMYVDLNPVRAALAQSPEQSQHTSAYDRIKGEKGQQMDSAAFDLIPVSTEQAGQEIKNTPVAQLREKRRRRRKNPTGKRIRRDGWLAPLTLGVTSKAEDPEVSRSGVRASDKGFLEISLSDYLRLLRWTSKQREDGSGRQVPASLQGVVSRLGIDLSMWRDLVWNFQRYFGQSCCAGSPGGMTAFAESSGRRWVKGQRRIEACFTT